MFDLQTLILFKVGLVLLLSAFMVVTAFSFLTFHVKKKETEYQRTKRIFGIPDDDLYFSTRSVSEEFAAKDFLLPVVFATVMSIFGFLSLLFGREIVTIEIDKPSFLLTGLVFQQDELIGRLRWQSMLVLSMAFVGAFIWSVQNIVRRLIAGDLTPSTYYGAGLRMVFAPIISLILSFLSEALPLRDVTREALPVVAFLTGMLPEYAFFYLKERFSIFSERENRSHNLSLEFIEGVNMFHKVRLSEVGIDNAQNLAEANIVNLLLKTPYNAAQLLDWIAQAKLYVYFKDEIHNLRDVGIRTVIDFRHALGSDDELDRISEETGISSLRLRLVARQTINDDGIQRLMDFQKRLNVHASQSHKLSEP